MFYFFCLFALSLIGGFLSFRYLNKDELHIKERIILGVILAISLSIILFFASMGIFPRIETYLPLNVFFVTVQATLWYALVMVFFGALMGLAKKHQKRGLLIMNVFFSFVVIFRIHHLLIEPSIYQSEANAREGICMQSTSYSCGAASVVNYLALDGVYITEGEAAKMAKTQPFGGTALSQATWAVNRFLEQSSIKRSLELRTLDRSVLSKLTRPCLAVVKLDGVNHLICVVKVESGFVYIKDSTRGKIKQSLDDFMKSSRGIIAV